MKNMIKILVLIQILATLLYAQNSLNYTIGLSYYSGMNVQGTNPKKIQDYKKAFVYFEKTIASIEKDKQNYPYPLEYDAYIITGTEYELGRGVKKDYDRAFENFKKAYELKTKNSETHMALSYANGIGTSINMNKAAEFYEKGIKRENNLASMVNLGLIYQ